MEQLSDPEFHVEMAAIQAGLARGDVVWVPHDEVERRLSERFGWE